MDLSKADWRAASMVGKRVATRAEMTVVMLAEWWDSWRVVW